MRCSGKALISVFFLLISCAVTGAEGKKNTLVVFYSRDGHTKAVARQLAARFNADIEELVDKKKRTGPVGFSAAGKDAITGNTTEIEPLKHDPADYSLILIGTPGWYGNVTPAVRTFVLRYDLSKKQIGLFGTVHLTGVENALKQLAGLISTQEAEQIPTLSLRHRDLKEDILKEKIEDFYQKVIKDL